MSIFTDIEDAFSTTEKDVLKIIGYIKTEIAVIESDVQLVFDWIGSNAPTIIADIEAVIGFVKSTGIGGPAVTVALTAAQEAVSVLTAVQAANQSGQGTSATAIAAYEAFKTAQMHAAGAAAFVVKTPLASLAAPSTLFSPPKQGHRALPEAVIEAGRHALRDTFPVGYMMASTKDIDEALTVAFWAMFGQYGEAKS